MKNFQDLKSQIEYPQRGIISKEVPLGGHLEATLFSLTAGANISDHTSTRAGLVLVLEGEGTFKLMEELLIMKSGVLITMPAQAVHAIQAKSNLSFLLILIN